MVDKLLKTLILVVVAVGISGGVWVTSNLLFNQVRRSWPRFSALSLGALGFFFGLGLAGNRVLRNSSASGAGWWESFARLVWFPIVAALIAAVVGFAVGAIKTQPLRTIIGTAGLGSLGVVAGTLMRSAYFPEFDLVSMLLGTAIGAGVGALISSVRNRPLQSGLLYGGAAGWVLGVWVAPPLGTGTSTWAVAAVTVPLLMIGAAIGASPLPDHTRRDQIDQTSRAFTFITPAVLFIAVNLVVPAARTLVLSLKDREGKSWVWLDNYGAVLSRSDTLDLSAWTNIFTSRLFVVAAVLAVITIVLGVRGKRQTGKFVELGGSSSFPMLAAAVFLAFAAFTVLRGTLINNLWWVVVVVIFSVALGLLVAVLADGRSGEKIAKSMVFMPMALSLVGASIIWRFMYVARDSSIPQTGVLNASWVALGRLSTGSGLPTLIVGAAAILLLLVLLALMARSLTRRNYGAATVPGIGALLTLWFAWRYWSPNGVGGVVPGKDGGFEPDTITFLVTGPFNNFWLMVVLVWIQVGFAMVILSAAIQAVPDELLEAARVDGATPAQVFWRVTLPQIANTIGVLVTTMIVLVMKVFDIVKVMTNGQFDTQVLANDMYNTSFQQYNFAQGSALAILILVLVLPVMVYNIYRMQKES